MGQWVAGVSCMTPTGRKALIDKEWVAEFKDLLHQRCHEGLVPRARGNHQGGLAVPVQLVEMVGVRLASDMCRLEWLARLKGWLDLLTRL